MHTGKLWFYCTIRLLAHSLHPCLFLFRKRLLVILWGGCVTWLGCINHRSLLRNEMGLFEYIQQRKTVFIESLFLVCWCFCPQMSQIRFKALFSAHNAVNVLISSLVWAMSPSYSSYRHMFECLLVCSQKSYKKCI